MIIVKTEIINSINDDSNIEWKICKDEKEVEEFIFKKKCDIDKWNYHTDGARSHRYLYTHNFSIDDFLALEFSELNGLQVKDFLTIIKMQA